ncbi:type I restriction enzyme HsdR N-terminal domain-containing protein [Bacteroidota bacterium]
MLDLNLPKYEYLIRKEDGKLYIYDEVRKMYVFLTPEEWVRQHVVNFLFRNKSYPKGLISLERGLNYNRMAKRADILVYDAERHPLLLIECKASTIELNEQVVFQLATYNSAIGASFVGISNGLQHFFWKMKDNGTFDLLPELPDYKDINNSLKK